jgi:hypothetical protein
LIASTLYVGMDPPGDVPAGREEAAAPAALDTNPAIATAVASDDAAGRAFTNLALARHPARATGLNASWIAISAAFGLVVLLLATVVHTESGSNH